MGIRSRLRAGDEIIILTQNFNKIVYIFSIHIMIPKVILVFIPGMLLCCEPMVSVMCI